jgi:hypothetical protein
MLSTFMAMAKEGVRRAAYFIQIIKRKTLV